MEQLFLGSENRMGSCQEINHILLFETEMLNNEELRRLQDYFEGRSDRETTNWVNEIFSEGENNERLKGQLLNEWEKIKENNASGKEDFETILDKLHHIIQLNELEKQNMPLRRILKIYMRIAAILLLPVLIAGAFLFSLSERSDRTGQNPGHSATIYAPMGSRVSFILPDGTSGKLNSGSYLSYSFSRNGLREASLSGEAWFEVKSDQENPFLIYAGTSTVKVTGTKFNLSAYPAENYIELVLDEGRVEFRDTCSGHFIVLNSSERVVSQNGNIQKNSVDPKKYHAWTDGRLVFKNDPMVEVVRRIERWYNVKINITDEEIEKYSFHATFQDDSIEEVLKFLSLTSPIGYKIAPRVVSPDGSYMKQEITIYKTE